MRLLLLLLFTAGVLVAGIAQVPSDAQVYDDLEMLRVAGLVRAMPPTSRPWTRAQVGRLVFEADSLSRGRVLAPGLRSALARVSREYQEYLMRDGGYGRPRQPILDLPVVPAGPQARFRADLFSRAGLSRPGDEILGYGSVGAVLENRPGDNFAFYERAEFTLYRPDTIEVSHADSGRYVPGTRVHAWKDGLGTFQIDHAWLAFRLPWQLRLTIGRDKYRWGPGYTGVVILGDETPALDHVALTADYGSFRFQTLTAYLSRWEEKHRFASWQRVELALWERLRLGGVLANVYAWDSLQTLSFFGMMNPLIPIYIEVAGSGHGDNLLVGWDAVFDLAPFQLYGALLLDNYEFIKRPQVPNATATQVGGRWVPNLPFELRAEYVGIAPFTYYHRIHHVMYENFGMPMGHGLGPDADLVDVRLGLLPLESIRFDLYGRQTRRGWYNRGDVRRKSWIPGQDTVPRSFPFEYEAEEYGRVECELRLGLEARYRPHRDLCVLGDFSWRRRENADGKLDNTLAGLGLGLRAEYRY